MFYSDAYKGNNSIIKIFQHHAALIYFTNWFTDIEKVPIGKQIYKRTDTKIFTKLKSYVLNFDMAKW